MHHLESRSGSTSGSSDDVHSLCSQLSHLGAPRSTIGSASSSSSQMLKNFTESAVLPHKPCAYSSIRLHKSHFVVEFVQRGELPTFRKQASRSTNNPWRRYGAMRKLCETGGFAPNNATKKERKNREQLVVVKPNVKLAPAPTSSQMTLNKVRDPSIYEKRLALHVPKNVPVDVSAQKLAEQVKEFVLNNGIELVDDESVQTAQSK